MSVNILLYMALFKAGTGMSLLTSELAYQIINTGLVIASDKSSKYFTLK